MNAGYLCIDRREPRPEIRMRAICATDDILAYLSVRYKMNLACFYWIFCTKCIVFESHSGLTENSPCRCLSGGIMKQTAAGKCDRILAVVILDTCLFACI